MLLLKKSKIYISNHPVNFATITTRNLVQDVYKHKCANQEEHVMDAGGLGRVLGLPSDGGARLL